MTGYIAVEDYVASSPATDMRILLREERIQSHLLRNLLAGRDAEIARLEGKVNYAYRQLAGTP